MAEYIDKDALFKDLIMDKQNYVLTEYYWSGDYIMGFERAMDIARKALPLNVAIVKHGKWLLERQPNGKPYCFHCSVCDSDFHNIGIRTAYEYCPNCGAKMDGGDNDADD